jgi:uncharacterized membrane protein (UPF0127 family)
MRTVKVISLKNQTLIAEKCFVAESAWSRAIGLLGRSSLNSQEAMLFEECTSVHMWGMRFPIDVVFLNQGKVTSLHSQVQPWRLLPLWDRSSRDVIEFPVGTIQSHHLNIGDHLCIS